MMAVATVSIEQCPVCGSTKRRFLFNGSDRLHDLPGVFPVVKCTECQSSYLAQRPAELEAYYPVESYAAYDRANTTRHYSRGVGRSYGLKQRRRLLERLKPAGGCLLDIGCGAGDFLALMQAEGQWQVFGLEPNAVAVRYAREERGLDVKIGHLPDSALPAQSFDAITMWHVLEHVPDPAQVLAEVHRLLKPNGVLVVGVPVSDSVEAKWFAANWAGYDVPRHLVTFTRASLSQLALRQSFRFEEQPGVVQGMSSLRISLGMWLGQRGGAWRRFRRLWLTLLLPPLYLILRLLSGSHLSVGVFVGHIVNSC